MCSLRTLFSVVMSLLLVASPAMAMTSTNFQINWDTVSAGGADFGTSANFVAHDTIGGEAAGQGSSANFRLSAGYRLPETANILGYEVKARAASPTPTWSAFNGTDQVTISSISGFVVGDLIAVVEDPGLLQEVAIGRITSIIGLVVTVDGFDGDTGTISAVPAGGDDRVYRLSSSTLALGSVSGATAATGVVGTNVITSVPTGYSLYVHGNHLLQSGLNTIPEVIDGSVTVGSEEFGASITGPGAVNSGTDLGVTTTLRLVQTNGAATDGAGDKLGFSYKLTVAPSTANGAYSQDTYYTLVANY